MGGCDRTTDIMQSPPPTAIPFATCTGNQEECSVELLSADRVTANNLSSVKCTRSGTNTTSAYSARYTDASQTGVQTINVLQDTLVVSAQGPSVPAVALNAAVVGDLKTFQYNGVCALEPTGVRVVYDSASGDRTNCLPFRLEEAVDTGGCSYTCDETPNTNVAVSSVCSAHTQSLSPGVTLVLRGMCNVFGEKDCTCAIETPPPHPDADTTGALPQPHAYYAV